MPDTNILLDNYFGWDVDPYQKEVGSEYIPNPNYNPSDDNSSPSFLRHPARIEYYVNNTTGEIKEVRFERFESDDGFEFWTEGGRQIGQPIGTNIEGYTSIDNPYNRAAMKQMYESGEQVPADVLAPLIETEASIDQSQRDSGNLGPMGALIGNILLPGFGGAFLGSLGGQALSGNDLNLKDALVSGATSLASGALKDAAGITAPADTATGSDLSMADFGTSAPDLSDFAFDASSMGTDISNFASTAGDVATSGLDAWSGAPTPSADYDLQLIDGMPKLVDTEPAPEPTVTYHSAIPDEVEQAKPGATEWSSESFTSTKPPVEDLTTDSSMVFDDDLGEMVNASDLPENWAFGSTPSIDDLSSIADEMALDLPADSMDSIATDWGKEFASPEFLDDPAAWAKARYTDEAGNLAVGKMVGDLLKAGQGIATVGGVVDTLSGGSRGYTSEGGITNIAPKTVTRGAPREVPNPYALPTIRAGY
jgi:hypothetical protein